MQRCKCSQNAWWSECNPTWSHIVIESLSVVHQDTLHLTLRFNVKSSAHNETHTRRLCTFCHVVTEVIVLGNKMYSFACVKCVSRQRSVYTKSSHHSVQTDAWQNWVSGICCGWPRKGLMSRWSSRGGTLSDPHTPEDRSAQFQTSSNFILASAARRGWDVSHEWTQQKRVGDVNVQPSLDYCRRPEQEWIASRGVRLASG